MTQKIMIMTPKLHISGGVASYWNSILPIMKTYENLEIENFQIGGHGKNIFSMIQEQLKFRKNININTSLVFLNPSLGFNSFFRDGLFAKYIASKNIPFVVFFHGWNLDFEKKVTKKYQKFFLNSFGKARKIFVLSKDFKDTLMEWGYQGEIIIETTNVDKTLVETFDFQRKQNDIQQTKSLKILFLARMLRAKGIFETIKAFNNLESQYDIELFVAGDGEDLDKVREITKENKNIHVLGRVEGQDKIDLFTTCHIYCFPTFYGEGLPTSILEAMAFQMPVITTNMGGLKEFFQDGEMGYLVEPKKVDQLVEKLEFLLTNRDKMIEIGNYNYHYAQEKLLNTVVAERIYGYIKSSIGDIGNVK